MINLKEKILIYQKKYGLHFINNILNENDFKEKIIKKTLFLNIKKNKISLSERCYCLTNEIKTLLKCPNCNTLLKFNSFNKGYNKYCSVKCSNIIRNKSIKNKEKIKQTNLKKYGKITYLTTEKCLEIRKKKNLEKYGVEHNFKSKEVQKKSIETKEKKYGFSSSFSDKKVRIKIKETNLKKYGFTNPSLNE